MDVDALEDQFRAEMAHVTLSNAENAMEKVISRFQLKPAPDSGPQAGVGLFCSHFQPFWRVLALFGCQDSGVTLPGLKSGVGAFCAGWAGRSCDQELHSRRLPLPEKSLAQKFEPQS